MQLGEAAPQRGRVEAAVDARRQHSSLGVRAADLGACLRAGEHVLGDRAPEDPLAQPLLAVGQAQEGVGQAQVGVDGDGVGLDKALPPGLEHADLAVTGVEPADQQRAQGDGLELGERVVGVSAIALGCVVDQELVRQVAGEDQRRRPGAIDGVRDRSGQRGVDERGVHVEVAPVDPLTQHGVERPEQLVGAHGRLEQGQPEVAREPNGGAAVVAFGPARRREIEADRNRVGEVLGDEHRNPRAVEPAGEADERRGHRGGGR